MWKMQIHKLAGCVGEHSKHRKNQRLSLKIEGFDLAGGTVDLFPYLGKPRKTGQILLGAGFAQMRGQPSIDGIDEGTQADAVIQSQCIAERMKRARVDARQRVQEIERALVQIERITSK